MHNILLANLKYTENRKGWRGLSVLSRRLLNPEFKILISLGLKEGFLENGMPRELCTPEY
jgi:hypothetical protein